MVWPCCGGWRRLAAMSVTDGSILQRSGKAMPMAGCTSSLTSMRPLRAGQTEAFERRLKAMCATAADGTELGAIYRDIGLPVMKALTAFHNGAYAQAVEHLLPARFDLWKMGGSLAERDVIDWTLAEAAVRAGQRDIALSLAHDVWPRGLRAFPTAVSCSKPKRSPHDLYGRGSLRPEVLDRD